MAMLLCFFYSTVAFVLECVISDSEIIINIKLCEFKARKFFIFKTSMKSKCKCGDVFGFKLGDALRPIAEPEREQPLQCTLSH